MTLQHQHPRQRGNIGRRQKRDQKEQIPQPRQRQIKQPTQHAQRKTDQHAHQRHAAGHPQGTAEHRRQLRVGNQRRHAAKRALQRPGAKPGENRLQNNKEQRQRNQHQQRRQRAR